MTYIAIILTLILLIIISFSAVTENIILKKELKQKKKQEEKNDEINKETVSNIENINTGDIEHDFNAGINQLHNFAEAGKK